ncbi:RNA polymerase-binding protein RbpA [Demequina pelophila]|uniref:RNA polymerase-binding protein RbpA n=1 Tax=Demequina pelophila TaxID=1638984 RepID=UPI0007860B84|nr:RNA polymerase-binding protein RbpA [Demequina pelophila]
MAGGNAIRGARVGSGPMGENERGETAARQAVSYYCARGHVTTPSFATGGDQVVPVEWDCPRCGFPAGLDQDNPPEPLRTEPYKTHLAYVKERRSDEEGESLLDEALSDLRERRGTLSVVDAE